MPFTWDSIVSFFSPPASRNTSPSLFSSPFSQSTESTTSTTKQTDLPMPPTSVFTASVGAAPMPSPAESSSSLAPSERDYFPPTSADFHRRPSMSSTASTAPSSTSDLQKPPNQIHPHPPQRTHTTTTYNNTTTDEDSARPPAPQRAVTTQVDGPLDPLSRSYPKPAHEPSLDELLARAPLKWSLGHYVKNARERKVVMIDEMSPEEERARRFEEAKRNLLRDKERIDEIARRR